MTKIEEISGLAWVNIAQIIFRMSIIDSMWKYVVYDLWDSFRSEIRIWNKSVCPCNLKTPDQRSLGEWSLAENETSTDLWDIPTLESETWSENQRRD